LELHCRQKAGAVQSTKSQISVVAASQQDFINSLLTVLMRESMNNLWVICGSVMNMTERSRIVDFGADNMHGMPDPAPVF
jgi:hypothetical protein